MKAGIRSTEFWVAATTVLGLLGSVLAGLSAPWAAPAAGVVAAAYAISRGLAKSKSIDTQATLGAIPEEPTPIDKPKRP